MRFLFTADGFKAIGSYGWMFDQADLLSAALNLAVTECVRLVPAYSRILRIRMGGTARQRAGFADDFARPVSSEQLEVKEQALRECALS